MYTLYGMVKCLKQGTFDFKDFFVVTKKFLKAKFDCICFVFLLPIPLFIEGRLIQLTKDIFHQLKDHNSMQVHGLVDHN